MSSLHIEGNVGFLNVSKGHVVVPGTLSLVYTTATSQADVKVEGNVEHAHATSKTNADNLNLSTAEEAVTWDYDGNTEQATLEDVYHHTEASGTATSGKTTADDWTPFTVDENNKVNGVVDEVYEDLTKEASKTCEHTALTNHTSVEATCTNPGNIEYWQCDLCGALFSDADAKTQVNSVVVNASGHIEPTPTAYVYTDEEGKEDSTYHWENCTVCGEAINKTQHDENGTDYTCSVCGYSKYVAVLSYTDTNGETQNQPLTSLKQVSLGGTYSSLVDSADDKATVKLLKSQDVGDCYLTFGNDTPSGIANFTLDLNNKILTINACNGNAGHISVGNSSNVTIKNGTIIGNGGSTNYGILYVDESTVNLENVTIKSGITSEVYNALYAVKGAIVSINHCNILGGNSDDTKSGYGIYIGNATVNISNNSLIKGGSAAYLMNSANAPAIYIWGGCTLSAQDSTIQGGGDGTTSQGYKGGAGIDASSSMSGSSITLTHCTVEGGKGSGGSTALKAAITAGPANLTIQGNDNGICTVTAIYSTKKSKYVDEGVISGSGTIKIYSGEFNLCSTNSYYEDEYTALTSYVQSGCTITINGESYTK